MGHYRPPVRPDKKSGSSPLESPPEGRRRACFEEAEKSQDTMDAEDGCPACLSEAGGAPWAEIAVRLGVSTSAAWSRGQKIEQKKKKR